MDDRPADAQPRRTLRSLQRRSAGAVGACRAIGLRRGTSPRSRTCRTGTTGRFGSPARTTCSATGKTALKANASKYIASPAAGYAANFNGMTYATQTRAWLDFDGNRSHLRRQRQHPVQRGDRRHVELRPDHQPARPGSRSAATTGNTACRVQHELIPRLSVTAGYHRRQFYNLDIIDNLNLGRDEWNPFTHRDADRPAAADLRPADHDVQPEANKVGMATDNLRTFSNVNTTSTTASRSAPTRASARRCSSAASRPSARATDRHVRRARQPERAALLRCDSAVPHDVQAVGAYSCRMTSR